MNYFIFTLDIIIKMILYFFIFFISFSMLTICSFVRVLIEEYLNERRGKNVENLSL